MSGKRAIRGLAGVVGAVALAAGLVIVVPAGTAGATTPSALAPAPDQGGRGRDPAPGPDPTTAADPTSPNPGGPDSTSEPDPVPPTSRNRGSTPESSPSTPPDPAAEAAKAEAELARQQASEAAEAAAELAAARRRTTEAWAGRGRPRRMIIVRDDSVDVVSAGRLVTQVGRAPGLMTLSALNRMVPDNWVALADGAARLTATVVLTSGTTLDIGGVNTLRLAGGPTPADASSIYTGSGRITARGVTVTSVEQGSDSPMPPGPGRPFLVVDGGGRMDTTDAIFSDLGTGVDDPDSRAGVQFNTGSGGSIVRTSFLRDTVGLRLAGSQGVSLDGVTVQESVGDGLVLQGDRGTTLKEVQARANGANGVLVKGVKGGASDRPITGITTSANGEYGVALVGLTAPVVTGVVTAADKIGGLRVNRCTQVTVTDLSATDQPIAVFTHVGSKAVVLDRLHSTGGRRGVVVEKSTAGLVVRQSVIDSPRSVGISIGGHDITLDGVSIKGARTAVRIERGAGGITTRALRLSGGSDGFVANPGTTGVVLSDFVAEGIGNDAVRTFSPDARISGGRIEGADTGIVAGAATAVSDTTVTKVDVGISSRASAATTADRVGIAALSVGIIAAPGASVRLTGSRVHALQALRGSVQLIGFNDLSLPPLNLLGAIGVPLVLLAIVLEALCALRLRGPRRPSGGPRVPPTLLPAGA